MLVNHMLFVQMPIFKEDSPGVSLEACELVVRLLYEFDKLEAEEQAAEIAEGKPVSRGSVLIFLPGQCYTILRIYTGAFPRYKLGQRE